MRNIVKNLLISVCMYVSSADTSIEWQIPTPTKCIRVIHTICNSTRKRTGTTTRYYLAAWQYPDFAVVNCKIFSILRVSVAVNVFVEVSVCEVSALAHVTNDPCIMTTTIYTVNISFKRLEVIHRYSIVCLRVESK